MLAAVRTASQTARGELELALLRGRYEGLIDEVQLRIQTATEQAPGMAPPSPPLSWQLSKANIETLEQSWRQIDPTELEKIRKAFPEP